MSKAIEQTGLLAELSMLERDGRVLTETWITVSAAAGAGDASKANDVLALDVCTHKLIRAITMLVVRMARGGFEAEDDGFAQCLALLCAVAEMSLHYEKTVEAARRVVELQREVEAARGFH